ncbi:hypothetical protein CBR_g16050 [Chara braunii]|uniref:Fe2OG dioxygenase domain-containing protein n=1 Tax=Chara braunii TaxID=69332 RepID=A0A388JSZ7_CHABU|nr:hypothetical protein CBR_g16050 [Chara braunii]|eukprot:GBG60928.1 hypothetical protein CBR_g16050 [Chara braunii]
MTAPAGCICLQLRTELDAGNHVQRMRQNLMRGRLGRSRIGIVSGIVRPTAMAPHGEAHTVASGDGNGNFTSMVAEIDPKCIVPEEHRATEADASSFDDSVERSVPVIDISALVQKSSDESAISRVVEQIGAACKEWGFFQAINHGVPQELLDELAAAEREFFALPLEEKKRVNRSITNAWGYANDELTKRTRDWKECFDFGPTYYPDLPDDHESNLSQDGFNQWPEGRPKFKSVLTRYFDVMTGLSTKLLEAIAMSLGLEADYFHQYFGKKHSSIMRLNFYPICPDPTVVMGVNRHKDAGALTVISQDDVGGLQVLNGGKWIGVKPIKGAFVINIGDMMQVWTNDIYKSPVHRVLANKLSARYSTPYFFNPAYETFCAPIEACVKPGTEPAYQPVSWAQYRLKRYEGDVSDRGEEVQIAQYVKG